jgi:hypothetical protein
MAIKNTKSNKRYWLCPLYSFNSYSSSSDSSEDLGYPPKTEDLSYPPESIDLSEGAQIQKVTPEIRNLLQARYPNSEAGTTDYVIVMPCKFDVTRYGKASFLREISDKTQLLFDLVTALRLCHAGGVTPGPLVYLASSGQSVFGDIFLDISKTEIDFTSLGLPEYDFYFSDIPVFNKLLTAIHNYRKAGKFSALDEALRRFNSSYSGEPEDRLIDQMIAFESLYIGERDELAYKLRLRAAFLLGKQRAKIFKDMSKAYKLRSDIVHGNKQVELFELEEIIPKTEEYLRQSIRKFLSLLSQGHTLKSLRQGTNNKVAELDENILTNGRTLAHIE